MTESEKSIINLKLAWHECIAHFCDLIGLNTFHRKGDIARLKILLRESK